MLMDTIFISIAAYKDRLLTNTINEAYSKAKYPANLVFGIFEQNTVDESINLDSFDFNNQIRYQRVDSETTKGVCWARKNVQAMFNNETYYFQIDAHMLFEQDWDEYFIDNLKETKKYHSKPIITAYPSNFDSVTFEKHLYTPNTVVVVGTDMSNGRDVAFKALGFSPPWGNSYYPSTHKIVHGYHLGACCIFAEGSFVNDIPYDDSIFFGGEEPMLTLRAWTHGYNIFHMGNLRVYHCWNKQYGGVVQKDYKEGQGQIYINAAKDYITRMINGEIIGEYGLGTVRTVCQYIDFSGIDYFNLVFNDKNKSVFDKPYYEQLTV